MLELIFSIIGIWIFFGIIDFAFDITWGVAKVIGGILIGLAVIAIVLCIIFAGGLLFCIPIAAIIGAVWLIRRASKRA